jgi:hypothetical protein
LAHCGLCFAAGNRGTPANHPNRDIFFAPISALSNKALKQTVGTTVFSAAKGVCLISSSRPLLSFSFGLGLPHSGLIWS